MSHQSHPSLFDHPDNTYRSTKNVTSYNFLNNFRILHAFYNFRVDKLSILGRKFNLFLNCNQSRIGKQESAEK